MDNLTEDEMLYMEQMEHWLEEQEMLTHQLERAVETYKKLSKSNEKQLALHVERVNITKTEFEKWKSDHGID